MGKKVLSLFLATVLLLSIFSTSVFALTSANPVGWEYEVSDSKATITAFSGIDSTLNVPESIDGYSVQGIAANVLNSGTLVNVYIPATCTSIDSSAIYAGATVYGIKGSAAETYADANSLSFVSIADSASYSTYVGKTITVNVNSEATIASNNSLTTINGNSVKAVASGTEELSVSLPNGIVGTIKIFIKEAPASISNVPATLKLYVGEKYQLSPKFSNGTYDETFNYGTTASAYAVVSNSGLIQAKGAGTVNIIVASAGLKATCVLTVLKKPTKVKLSATDILIGVGESKTLSYTLGTGEKAKTVTYTTDNYSIATVASNGKVIGKGVGTTKVRIKLDNGLTDSCIVTVGKAPTSISISRTAFSMGIGEKVRLYPTVNGGAVCSTYIWKSVTPSIATVDSNGVVIGKKVGTVKIAVYPYNYNSKSPTIKAIATVTVKKAPTSLSYQKSAITLGLGEKYDLNLKYPSGTASCYNYTKIDDTSIATYSTGIVVNAKAIGKTRITTTTFNNKVAKCDITVKKAPIAVACKPTALKLALKQTYQLKPYVNATSACSSFKYKSGNTNVCTVSSTGKITVKDYGACNVYIYTYNHTAQKPIYTKVLIKVGYITHRIASYTTYFDTSLTGKSHNLKLACKYINGKTDGYILQPGQTFSYNAAVGARTSARGFVEGLVVAGNGYAPGIGGGICQGATTVFNAALLGNVQITERHNHNLKSSYVPVGRDATVYWGVQDCKIRNNYKTPIRIKMTYNSGGSINCAIYTLKKVSKPKIDLKVSYSGGTYVLRRYAGGKVNYTAYSRYAN